MTAIHVAYHDGAHRCYVTETGRDRRYVGCGHLSPRSAIEHSDALMDRREPLPGPVRRAAEPRAKTPVPPEVRALLEAGKLEQACPCGRWEAAHFYCSQCFRLTGPADWYPNGDKARRTAVVGAARAAEIARPKRSRGPRRGGPGDAQTPLTGSQDADSTTDAAPTHSEAPASPSGDAGPGLRGVPASSPSTVRSHPATEAHESPRAANPQTSVRSGSRLGDPLPTRRGEEQRLGTGSRPALPGPTTGGTDGPDFVMGPDGGSGQPQPSANAAHLPLQPGFGS